MSDCFADDTLGDVSPTGNVKPVFTKAFPFADIILFMFYI